MQLDLSGIPILVVDDQPVARSLLLRMLRRLGFAALHEAAEGEAAMTETLLQRPAMIFCDVHMQPEDGLTFLTKLRFETVPPICTTPVILVTSEEREMAVSVSRQLQVTDYLVKPVSLTAVRASAGRALGFEI